ncbi:carbon-monoxide dehydrogenase small subunit [Picrophilus oshimae DSM 9789]|uniref:Carbon-monoxide dehydrogenase small subunit n=2 Tax=Picrophilus torridus (strain ATCC 700027 / DSM 9790 / JCM 10055 / NBRC 100828 / KAW 2/3) TaxID=1122961 RepID=A0A8G2FXK5_PICTO|nr:carbon-monoxide dehydrogenase small subunit [Picrophilus oshimae DSM 9789]
MHTGGITMFNLKIKVNGRLYEKEVEPRKLLVSFLREDLGLTGTHIGCDTTNCGACTVLMDGLPVKSCTVLAVQANNHNIMTVENSDETLSNLKESFLKNNGLQCGYCTPGMLMTSFYIVNSKIRDDDEIKRNLEGNLCRCTGYDGIIKSIREVSRNEP